MNRQAFAISLTCFGLAGMAACTQAQGTMLLNGLPADAADVVCVVETAMASGANVAAIAAACGTDTATVAEILWETATLPSDAGSAQADVATKIRSAPAFAEVYKERARRVGK